MFVWINFFSSSRIFNFTNFDVDFNLGEEDQKSLTKESVTTVEYNKSIYGPNNPNQGFDASLNLDSANKNNQESDYGMRTYSAIDGTHSKDIQSDGSSQSISISSKKSSSNP